HHPERHPEPMGAREIGSDAVDGGLIDAVSPRTGERLAGDLDDGPSVAGFRHGALPAMDPCLRFGGREPSPSRQPTSDAIDPPWPVPLDARVAHSPAGHGGDFAAKIAVGPVDPLAQRVAHIEGDADRAASLGFRILDGLRHALALVVNERLIDEANL